MKDLGQVDPALSDRGNRVRHLEETLNSDGLRGNKKGIRRVSFKRIMSKDFINTENLTLFLQGIRDK